MLLDRRTIEDNFQTVLSFHDWDYTRQDEITRRLTKMQFLNFRLVAQLPFETLAKLLCVSEREIANMKENRSFELIVADRFGVVIDIYSHLYRKQPIRENVNYWMHRRRKELHMRSPIEIMETLTGIAALRDYLRLPINLW